MFQALYGDLRRLAPSHMRQENPGHTLSATALLHEAWFRLDAQQVPQWKNRAHFLAMASTMMRRILVTDVVAVHEALLAFAVMDPRAARMVERRFFGGLTNDEIAEVLEVSLATVKRDWDLARAWLRRELGRCKAA